jgi:acetyl-CoA acyltransferase
MSDASSMVVLMSAERAAELGIRPIARFVTFTVAGVDPKIMGIGPIKAVPRH